MTLPPPTTDSPRDVDVLDISDLRFPGGTSHSVAEEIQAQATAGWTTGLVHLNGPLVSKVREVNPLIRAQVRAGNARLLIGRDPVRAGVVVVRHPAVLEHAAEQLPPISTEHVVVVANAAPLDIDGHRHYTPQRVHAIALEHFGVAPVWAPIGPQVRESIREEVPAGSMLAEDWVNIIDVDAWAVTRDGWAADVAVIGRHSRNSPQKWPRDRHILEAVYPVDGSVRVAVLGGAEPAARVLGQALPDSWQVLPFGALPAKNFLAGLDFFVYYHDPQWVEAFGRTILEAMASGVPAILPPHFRELFGEAAVYAEPEDVRATIARLRADRAEWERVAERASALTRERFGREAHVQRITTFIDRPAVPDAEAPVVPVVPTSSNEADPAPVDTSSSSHRPRLLLISSNGAGMGHLTRLLSYARRAEPSLEPHVLSLSQAVGVVGSFGYPYEYLPSTGATGMAPRRWHPLFADRVSETIARIDPAVVVFDGTWPYDGIPVVRERHPGPRWVWSRRGLWRAHKNAEQLAKADWFDLVIEPGDLADPLDRGATREAPASRVGPVTLLDPTDLTGRAEAREVLGLPAEGPLALVSLGAGNINDTSGDVGAAVAALRSLGVDACVTQTQIAAASSVPDDVHVVRHFPLSRHFRAFDVAVSATGYNSFHEFLRFGVPTLFVPNTGTALDDTEARSRWAAQQGWSHELPSLTPATATPLLAELLERGPEMAARAVAADPGNGAPAAADLLVQLASQVRTS
ncbi:glycosyltransferase family protein [Auraticoccus monumenti]|uniref:Glycosyltransferase involved in cell wall bisynthesis n=1 Tax=Auraticoccus monumenti TaxID=675864 RepID=A0A1G6RIY2_9ACTN|nr:glycosyltransferase [Auraticoccus monumenti]SDD03927.1 Glycosyltransferase involved in cell wall bisynthesis [Auraticoccus monumenti]